MKRYLLDTNHLGEAIGQVSVVRDRLQQMYRQGAIFGTCGPVLCELMLGVVMHKDADKLRIRLNNILGLVRLWPTDLSIADKYSTVYHELKSSGRALSQVDIILAAMVRQMKATLLTTDRDFEALPDIKTENWIVSAHP